jgi:S1-C subfamily serine protease
MKDKLGWVAVIVASVALGAGAVVGIDSLRADNSSAPSVIERVSEPTTSGVADTSLSDVADLYAKVRPSIVQINSSTSRGESVGSGIVLDRQGHILTNNHVIEGAGQLDVTFSDGNAAIATVVGRDPGNDLAVIKVNISGDKLSPATLADSDKVRVGEFVIAVGNPFGIEGSLTSGIVSGVGRTLGTTQGGRPLRQLIQSDAAINPGNSGGALFNRRGEVIGVTSAIQNPSGNRVFAGIGYAVPVNAARRYLPEMMAGKTVEHPRLGVGLQNVTPALAKSFNLGVEQGVLITQVEANSAAAKAQADQELRGPRQLHRQQEGGRQGQRHLSPRGQGRLRRGHAGGLAQRALASQAG